MLGAISDGVANFRLCRLAKAGNSATRPVAGVADPRLS